MKHTARDGTPFNQHEQSVYNNGYQLGIYRYNAGEFMGSAYTSAFKGRNRLIFSEGLEDGYSGICHNDIGTCVQIGKWIVDNLAIWKGFGVRIVALIPPGERNNDVSLATISNADVSTPGNIKATVMVNELAEYRD